MGLTKTETWICDLCCLAYLFVLNSAQSSGNNWKFHKFLLVKNYFLIDNSSKGFFSFKLKNPLLELLLPEDCAELSTNKQARQHRPQIQVSVFVKPISY